MKMSIDQNFVPPESAIAELEQKVNQHGQVVIRNTGLPSTDHLQSMYQLGGSGCGHVYGANGTDSHLRLCPRCQTGALGLRP